MSKYNMFKIFQKDMKIKVVCDSCYSRGYIDTGCYKCGGKGTRNKTIQIWKYKRYDIEKIDRVSSDHCIKEKGTIIKEGELRYWIDNYSYFVESEKLIHFTKQDAIKECVRRNKEKHAPLLYMDVIKEIEKDEEIEEVKGE